MNPTPSPSANTELEGQKIHVGRIESGPLAGEPCFTTAWLPTKEEIADLIDGRPVLVSIVGTSLPFHIVGTR